MRTHIDLLPSMLDFERAAKPLYIQIEGILFDLIKRGKVQKGETLPPISKMAEALEVDRLTVRRAIQSLEAGKIVKSFRGRGKGTVVLYTPGYPPKMVLDTKLKTVMSHGDGTIITVLDSTPYPAERIELREGNKADSYQLIRRVHSKNGGPYGYLNLHIASDVYDLGPKEIENNLAIRTVIGLVGKSRIANIYQYTTIGKASKEEAKHLQMPVGEPTARTRRVMYNTSNVAIYINDIVYPGESFEVRVDLNVD